MSSSDDRYVLCGRSGNSSLSRFGGRDVVGVQGCGETAAFGTVRHPQPGRGQLRERGVEVVEVLHVRAVHCGAQRGEKPGRLRRKPLDSTRGERQCGLGEFTVCCASHGVRSVSAAALAPLCFVGAVGAGAESRKRAWSRSGRKPVVAMTPRSRSATVTVVTCRARLVGESEDDVGVQQVHDGRIVGVHDGEHRNVQGAGELPQDLARLRQVLAGQRQAGLWARLQPVDDHERQVVDERCGVGDRLGRQITAVIDEQRRVTQPLERPSARLR